MHIGYAMERSCWLLQMRLVEVKGWYKPLANLLVRSLLGPWLVEDQHFDLESIKVKWTPWELQELQGVRGIQKKGLLMLGVSFLGYTA